MLDLDAVFNDDREPGATTTTPSYAPADLSPEWRELYAERAAVREYDGGQAREHAEAEALAEVLARMKTTTAT